MEEQVYTLGVWHVKEGREAEFVIAWKELGAVFYRKGLYDKAVQFLTRARAVAPDDARVWYSLGLAQEARPSRRSTICKSPRPTSPRPCSALQGPVQSGANWAVSSGQA